MAATPSKPSPSNQTVEESNDVASNDAASNIATATDAKTAAVESIAIAEPVEAAASEEAKAPPSIPTTTATTEPSYDDSEQSGNYVLAKNFLNDGDFEQALTTIEEGIEGTKFILAGNDNLDTEFHESLAPFHYLYGTTLLYSIEESNDTNMTTSGGGGGGEADPDDENADAEEAADDMQIAWENLEAARTILENMMTSNDADKLKLDLAQVLLREGDLQRLNGRYETAINDYQSCLVLREGNPLLGPYDRKIADVHYNLGLNYMMLVADAKGATEETTEAPKSEKTLAELRSKSFHHYLACSKTLCGQIAFLCNVDSDEFLKKAEQDIPNFKSTGEDDDAMDHPKIVSMKLQAFRKHVLALQAPSEHLDIVSTLSELLDEIQETIDESENSEKGVQQVSEMKAEISAAVAAEPGDSEDEGAAGATTTVGFGSAAAAASTVTANPVMAVRKKNKRPAEDAKMPPQNEAKRTKDE
jgi:tetratricopeptide (TPR) repeat protein